MNLEKSLHEISRIKNDILTEQGVDDSWQCDNEGRIAFQILNLLEAVLKAGKNEI